MQNIDGVVAAVFKRHYAATQHKHRGVDHKSGKVAQKEVVGTVDWNELRVRLDAHSQRIALRARATKEVKVEVKELEETVTALVEALGATREELKNARKLYTAEVARLNGDVASLGQQLALLQTEYAKFRRLDA
jgi:predicted  nucleic acid-binding Zn-ribbon protein